jgi:hypothetical protein
VERSQFGIELVAMGQQAWQAEKMVIGPFV